MYPVGRVVRLFPRGNAGSARRLLETSMQFENACGQADLKRTEIGAGDATPAPILVVIFVVRSVKFGDPTGSRTRLTGLKSPCPNR